MRLSDPDPSEISDQSLGREGDRDGPSWEIWGFERFCELKALDVTLDIDSCRRREFPDLVSGHLSPKLLGEVDTL